MLDIISSGLLSLWLDTARVHQTSRATLVWQRNTHFVLPTQPDTTALQTVDEFLKLWTSRGWDREQQGVWLQTGPSLLADNQGKTPLSAASLTKVATTLAALKTWEPDHQFETVIGATGPIVNGELQGDLIITGGNDPHFVWEEAIALGNALHQLGILRVTGHLILVGNFSMNYESDPGQVGQWLKQSFNSTEWDGAMEARHQRISPVVPRPLVAIAGGVKTTVTPVPNQTLLLRHQSLPLTKLLHHMNTYSSNALSEAIAEAVGGAEVVRTTAAQAAGVPLDEILIINGSGLGAENRISPRAAVAMLMAIQREINTHNLTLADVFPVIGRDKGTAEDRQVSVPTAIKTGTLWDVSALAGVLPTRDRGLVWFAIINRGGDIENFRQQQDRLLNQLIHQWGAAPNPTPAVTPKFSFNPELLKLGAPGRNKRESEFSSSAQAESKP
ncbi:MAG: D-alanyl-D-alanine carboxypeptidase [Desertifilum sp. SIO1I2]|nr:D-alanyl-D-alanine carboxypeptidase [Desertifilum sp. SIO1I2]